MELETEKQRIKFVAELTDQIEAPGTEIELELHEYGKSQHLHNIFSTWNNSQGRNFLMLAILHNKEKVVYDILDILYLGSTHYGFWTKKKFVEFLCQTDHDGNNVLQLALLHQSYKKSDLLPKTLLNYAAAYNESKLAKLVDNLNNDRQSSVYFAFTEYWDEDIINYLLNKSNWNRDIINYSLNKIGNRDIIKYLLNKNNWNRDIINYSLNKNNWNRDRINYSLNKNNWNRDIINYLLNKNNWNKDRINYLLNENNWDKDIINYLLNENNWNEDIINYLLNENNWDKDIINYLLNENNWNEDIINYLLNENNWNEDIINYLLNENNWDSKAYNKNSMMRAIIIYDDEEDNKRNARSLDEALCGRGCYVNHWQHVEWDADNLLSKLGQFCKEQNMQQLWVLCLTHGVYEYILDSSGEKIKIERIVQAITKASSDKTKVTTFHN